MGTLSFPKGSQKVEMWKSNFMKWAYGLNAHLNTTGVGSSRFVRSLKRRGKQLMMKIFAPNNLCLIKVNDMTMYVRANTSAFQEYVLNPFEPYTTELFKQTVKPGATVLDIGAQFGYYSLIAVKQSGSEGRVYAFEPVPVNFDLLKHNIQVNGYAHIIHAIQKAVGDKRTTVRIFVYRDSDSHGMYRHLQAAVKETIEVECITIDEFLGGQPVDVIKIDIEGNEPYALKGMKQTIARSPNLILLAEFAPAYLRRAGAEPKDYLRQLKDLGFNIQLVDENLRCLKPATEDILAQDNPSWYVNLYCTKRKSLRKP